MNTLAQFCFTVCTISLVDALDRQVARWCGELNRTEIQSTESSLYISFTSDSNITGQGFVMEYYTTTQETGYLLPPSRRYYFHDHLLLQDLSKILKYAGQSVFIFV